MSTTALSAAVSIAMVAAATVATFAATDAFGKAHAGTGDMHGFKAHSKRI